MRHDAPHVFTKMRLRQNSHVLCVSNLVSYTFYGVQSDVSDTDIIDTGPALYFFLFLAFVMVATDFCYLEKDQAVNTGEDQGVWNI